MKIFLLVQTILFCLSFTSTAQFNDIDLDSIQYLGFEEGDSINGIHLESNVYEYLTPFTRNIRHDSIWDGGRMAYQERFQEVNSDGNTISSSTNYFSSDFDKDNCYTGTYQDGNLVEGLSSYFSDQDWNYGENIFRSTYAVYDEYGNYTENKEYRKDGDAEVEYLFGTFILEHSYANGNLDSTITYRLNEQMGGLDESNFRYYIYNDDDLISEYEYYRVSYYGEKEISQRIEYFYNDDGTLKTLNSYFSDYFTDDPTDLSPPRIFHYFYNDNQRLIERQVYRANDQGEHYLSQIAYYFRNNTSATKDESNLIDQISIKSSTDINYLRINIEGLDQSKNYKVNIVNQSGHQTKQIDISKTESWSSATSLPAGIYFINVISEEGQVMTEKAMVF